MSNLKYSFNILQTSFQGIKFRDHRSQNPLSGEIIPDRMEPQVGGAWIVIEEDHAAGAFVEPPCRTEERLDVFFFTVEKFSKAIFAVAFNLGWLGGQQGMFARFE